MDVKELNLIPVTSAISRKQPDWPEYHHVCGAITVPNAAENGPCRTPEAVLKNGPAPVFITLGSMLSWMSPT
jgi:hypothetical protein